MKKGRREKKKNGMQTNDVRTSERLLLIAGQHTYSGREVDPGIFFFHLFTT